MVNDKVLVCPDTVTFAGKLGAIKQTSWKCICIYFWIRIISRKLGTINQLTGEAFVFIHLDLYNQYECPDTVTGTGKLGTIKQTSW